MHQFYLRELNLIADRHIDVAFVPMDARQEALFGDGLAGFLAAVKDVEKVYPMHYWDKIELMDQFLAAHPQYRGIVLNPEKL